MSGDLSFGVGSPWLCDPLVVPPVAQCRRRVAFRLWCLPLAPFLFSDLSGSVGPLSVSTPALLKGFCDALTIFVHLLLYGSHLGVGVDGDVVGL